MHYVAIPKQASMTSPSDRSYRNQIVATVSSQKHKSMPDIRPEDEENASVANVRQMSIPTVSRPQDYNFGGDPML